MITHDDERVESGDLIIGTQITRLRFIQTIIKIQPQWHSVQHAVCPVCQPVLNVLFGLSSAENTHDYAHLLKCSLKWLSCLAEVYVCPIVQIGKLSQSSLLAEETFQLSHTDPTTLQSILTPRAHVSKIINW